MIPDPIGKLFFGDMTGSEREHCGDDLGISGLELVTVRPEEGCNGEEADALVAIPIGMVLHQPEAVSGGQGCEIAFLGIDPFVARPRER